MPLSHEVAGADPIASHVFEPVAGDVAPGGQVNGDGGRLAANLKNLTDRDPAQRPPDRDEQPAATVEGAAVAHRDRLDAVPDHVSTTSRPAPTRPIATTATAVATITPAGKSRRIMSIEGRLS